jgi:hypothetical protein
VTERKLGERISAMFRKKREETEGLTGRERGSESPPLGRERNWVRGVVTEGKKGRVGGAYERKAALIGLKRDVKVIEREWEMSGVSRRKEKRRKLREQRAKRGVAIIGKSGSEKNSNEGMKVVVLLERDVDAKGEEWVESGVFLEEEMEGRVRRRRAICGVE